MIKRYLAAAMMGWAILGFGEDLKIADFEKGTNDFKGAITFDNMGNYFNRGFEIRIDSSQRRGCGLLVSCEEINARLLQMLRHFSATGEDFFAFVHYWDPHTP